MQRTPTNSSNIFAFGYDAERQILEIEFRGSRDAIERKVFQYAPVTPELYDEFRLAPSLGALFARYLRNNPHIITTLVDSVATPSKLAASEIEDEDAGEDDDGE